MCWEASFATIIGRLRSLRLILEPYGQLQATACKKDEFQSSTLWVDHLDLDP
jgi:hypothetical protein